MQLGTLKDFTNEFYKAQKSRIRNGNIAYAAKRELVLPYLDTESGNAKVTIDVVEAKYEELKDTFEPDVIADIELRDVELYQSALAREKRLGRIIEPIAKALPIYEEWLQYVNGIGHLLTASLVSRIRTAGRFATVSKLWQYSGLGVMKIAKVDKKTRLWFPTQEEAERKVRHAVDLEEQTAQLWGKRFDKEGKFADYIEKCVWGLQHEYIVVAQKRISGFPALWNNDLLTTCWKVGESFQKQSPAKSKYRAFYDETKQYYTEKHNGEKSKSHINNMTKRKTVKLFMSHLWVQWRKLEGLPLSKPYCIEHLDHSDYIEPFYDIEADNGNV